jgi:hypothetical protein
MSVKTSPSVVYWLACLPLDPRYYGSNPAEGNIFLRAIKVGRTSYFGREVKPSALCEILRRVKDHYDYERDISKAKFIISFAVSSCFATR